MTPVGDPRSRRGTALSVSPKTARWLDAGQLVEIEIDDCLQCLAGGAGAPGPGKSPLPPSRSAAILQFAMLIALKRKSLKTPYGRASEVLVR